MRTAVVTGGSSGIGLAVARLLRRRGGWRLVLAARDPGRLGAACRELGARGVPCDVTDDREVGALAAAVADEGGCDLLVQSAGVSGHRNVLEADLDVYARVLGTNYLGLLRVAHALWPQLVERRGRVANVVSVAGTVALARSNPYAVSKRAALAWSRALVAEGRAAGVQVTTVNPGPVATAGFPQTALRRGRLGRLLVTDADVCATRLLAAVDRGAAEVFVPQWFRVAAALDALAPARVARAATRWGGGAAELDAAPAAGRA